MSQNNTTSLKVPKLRFREFWGEYREAVLTEILKIKHGFPFNSESFSRSWDYVVLTPGNFYEEWGYKNRWENQKYYLWEIPSDYILNIWDMLIAMTEQAPWLLWSPILIPETWKFLHNQRLWLVQVIDEEKFSKQFLYFFFNTKKVRDAIFSTASGTKVRHTSPDRIGKLNINLPSPREQQKIASFLSLADEKIEKLKNKKSLIEKYKKWMMQKIFSQEIRFKDENGEEYGDWEEKQLGKFCQTFAWGTPRSTNKNYYYWEIPFIKSWEIDCNNTEQFLSEEWFKNSSAKLIKKWDLLYALYWATSWKVAISKLDWAINQAVLCIRTTENIYFLYSILNFKKDSLLDFYIQWGQWNLSAEIVKSFQFPIPPLPEQQKIASFLSEIDTKIESLSSEIERVEKWKKGLLQGMFI